MTTIEDQTYCERAPGNRELHVEMNKALSEAKRLRRRICRMLAIARSEVAAGKPAG